MLKAPFSHILRKTQPAWLPCLLGTAGLGAAEDGSRLVRETAPLPAEVQQARLHVPEGFQTQLFASEPMINKPINMAFDSKGRLWVSSTVEYPYAAAKDRWADSQGSRVKDSRDAVKVLEDTDGDGRADKATDFADGLNIPTGVLPWHKPEHKAGCIAFSIPNIWYFADTDGDDRADLREVLFGPLGYEKDTHGMCSSFRLGPDGWVYATHGFNNTSSFKAKDGSTLDLHSGNVFRFRPDGSRVELFSSGQVNPFGLAWDRRGNLYSADCHSNPITQIIRGAHCQSFGKPHDGLGFAPVMCEHSHGSTGLCGVVYIDGGIWGPEWDDHMLVGNCVTSRINHDLITFTGTTPKANERPDFLTSDDPWFRPVDLQLGPDNALYVADFYNRIIGHYEVPLDHPGRDKERGRIWRIIKTDASKQTRQPLAAPRAAHLVELEAADPFTVRATAAWFAEHPSPPALSVLIGTLQKTAKEDASLVHQLRIAIRENLKAAGAIPSLSAAQRIAVLDIIKAVPTAEAASTLLELAPDELGLIARHADDATLEKVVALGQKAADPPQAVIDIHAALLERGTKPSAALIGWATSVAERLLGGRTAEAEWSHSGGESPWCLEKRSASDGRTIEVISSLNRELRMPEKLTGTLRSTSFPAPATLSFWICGHMGFPKADANQKNFVRLVDEKGKALQRALPPRNDVAQRVEWDLSKLKGQKVRLEIVDGDTGTAFAWLGVGRIEPAVVSTSTFNAASTRQKQLRQLAALLRTTAPAALRDRLAAFLPPAPKVPTAKPRPELEALITARAEAFAKATTNPARGEQIFTANCAVCHAVKGRGNLIGPQLDGIGSRGAARVIEDILDPWRNIDSHFQLHQIQLRNGGSAGGSVRSETSQMLVLVDATGNEQRLAKADIASDTALPASLMPPTFNEVIKEEDFYHLLAWLMKN